MTVRTRSLSPGCHDKSVWSLGIASFAEIAVQAHLQQTVTQDLRSATVEKAYRYWAAVYDAICAPLFRPAHLAAASAANRIGGAVLEVGVGTGLLLPLYDRRLRVTGLDLSEDMLARARRRLGAGALPHVVALQKGDIHEIAHPAASYDAIVMPFVLTLLEGPERALENCRRMLRPGGEIIIVSHFQSTSPRLAQLEQWLAPRVAGLGLRPDFPVARIASWASMHPDLGVPIVTSAGPLGIYRLVRIAKRGQAASCHPSVASGS
jgi:phosphatidylethanolamine/phosphatidyl-N-methylethanolamine N-methyltransferase